MKKIRGPQLLKIMFVERVLRRLKLTTTYRFLAEQDEIDSEMKLIGKLISEAHRRFGPYGSVVITELCGSNYRRYKNGEVVYIYQKGEESFSNQLNEINKLVDKDDFYLRFNVASNLIKEINQLKG